MEYIKAKTWKGQDLKGDWLLTKKIDGVRVLKNEAGELVSRNGKPLYNMNHLKELIHDHEVFFNSWNETVSMVRTHNGPCVSADCLYDLRPDHLDSRLVIGWVSNPSAELILHHLQRVLSEGLEGLVLRDSSGSRWLRVKPSETHDVRITGYLEGRGKHLGRCGALLTPMGKVGTGLTDALREELAALHAKGELIGRMIEVEAMEITATGKFRHPRFIRFRPDKE